MHQVFEVLQSSERVLHSWLSIRMSAHLRLWSIVECAGTSPLADFRHTLESARRGRASAPTHTKKNTLVAIEVIFDINVLFRRGVGIPREEPPPGGASCVSYHENISLGKEGPFFRAPNSLRKKWSPPRVFHPPEVFPGNPSGGPGWPTKPIPVGVLPGDHPGVFPISKTPKVESFLVERCPVAIVLGVAPFPSTAIAKGLTLKSVITRQTGTLEH